MKERLITVLFTAFLLSIFGGVWLFAQDTQTQEAPIASQSQSTPIATQEQAVTAVTEPEVQWLWGEVVSIDENTKQLLIRYLDYETDSEKVISINTDAKTIYENAKSLEEIKTQDTLSIDYVATLDGKNIAKNISIEKNEGAEQVMLEESNREEAKTTP